MRGRGILATDRHGLTQIKRMIYIRVNPCSSVASSFVCYATGDANTTTASGGKVISRLW
jgi:hypothetical protein